ncbi:MAG TPA: 4-demethylwyosine synthase TYW1 [Candidatus Nanoarchaeia archaeon]|nr:4-demethylwyosine synthase TYW1 [Candidatus Nanoarchaeia archaeon]
MSQLTDPAKKKLTKQGYRIIGNHSAVKTCGWTKNMIRGKGGCYKLKFYGIMSNQCMQMSTSISCANRCVFCWRDYKAPVSKEWKWEVDEPQFILDGSIKQHHKLLDGFGGNTNKNPNKTPYEKSKIVRHVALSLTGEPITYPRINELINLFNKRGISTFLVTNAQYPESIKNLSPVTQLYISLDAPEKPLLEEIDKPLFKDYWERLQQSLDYLSQKKQRTTIRLTMIRGLNMVNPQAYAEMIKKGNPDFIEVKAYMHVGASVNRLNRSCMPSHDEVVDFSVSLLPFLEEYEIVTDHRPSWVVLLAKKKFKKSGVWYTWIDFNKYFGLVNSGKDPLTEEYLSETPLVGLSSSDKQEINEMGLF